VDPRRLRKRAVFAETSAHEAIVASVRGRLPALAQVWMIGALDALAGGGGEVSDERLEQRRAGRGPRIW
jgi:long-chain acyl-CoA synthetase